MFIIITKVLLIHSIVVACFIRKVSLIQSKIFYGKKVVTQINVLLNRRNIFEISASLGNYEFQIRACSIYENFQLLPFSCGPF